MKIIKEIDRIKVTGIDKPTVRQLIVYQEIVVDRDEDGVSHIPGYTFIKTMMGDPVNQISDTQFQIVPTGEILTKVNA
ncbi:MAG: hypothetical protein ACI4QS_10830 [Comamonas sp.]